MNQPQLAGRGENHYALTGELSWQTVPSLLREHALNVDAGSKVVIDLAGVERSDSAGLALLIEWLREARRSEGQLVFANLPEQMLALARVSGLESVLTAS